MFLVPALRRLPAAAAAPLGAAFDGDFERFFERALEPSFGALAEKDGVWTVTLDVPGVTREQLAIELDGRRVNIRSKEGAPRLYASAFVLPAEIDAAASEARLENGVLTLRLARKVPVKTSAELEIH